MRFSRKTWILPIYHRTSLRKFRTKPVCKTLVTKPLRAAKATLVIVPCEKAKERIDKVAQVFGPQELRPLAPPAIGYPAESHLSQDCFDMGRIHFYSYISSSKASNRWPQRFQHLRRSLQTRKKDRP